MKMNLTHEYTNVWHERKEDSNVSKTGLDENLWKILSNKNDVIWTTSIAWDAWQNFAVTVDYVNK